MKRSVFGIKIDAVSKKEIVERLVSYAKGDGKRTAFYLNAHCVNTAFADETYKSILNKADMVYAGGMGVVWAAGFLGQPLPERVNILDFLDALIDDLVKKDIAVYLLGSHADEVEDAAGVLKKRGVKIAGSRDGFFADEDGSVVDEINKARPDVLIVGMGVPKQEQWIDRNRDGLDARLCWGVGAAFEWISGHKKRAPEWMIRGGLEWAHRFFQHPGRFWKRYLIGNPLFIYRLLKEKIRKDEKSY